MGWFTSLGGSVYSGGDVDMVLSSSTEYGGFDTNEPYMTDSFAFSPAEIEVNSVSGGEVISSKGYARNIGIPFDFVYGSSSSVGAVDLEEISSLASLDPSTLYKMSVDDMNDILKSGDIDYSSAIDSDGVVVIYLEGSEDLVFMNNFKTSNANKKLLLVSTADVWFSPNVGTVGPLTGSPSDAHINVSIVTSGDIYFPTGIASDNDDPAADDGTLVLHGSLFAAGNIDFSRDRGLQNTYPSVAVHFDPSYMLMLQNQLNGSADFQRQFFSLVSISWDLGD